MATWEFPSTSPIELDVSIAAGSVAITAAQTDVVTVAASRSRPRPGRPGSLDNEFDDELEVDFSGGHLVISQSSQHGLRLRNQDVHLVIGVPADSGCLVRTASADVSAEGVLGALEVRTASGSVEAATVHGPADVSSMSGQVRLGRVAADVSLQTASGQIQLRHADGDVTAQTASGEVSIGTATGSVSVKTASGRVRIASIGGGHADVNSVSGDVEVKVVPGVGVYLDLASITGRVTSELEPAGQDGAADLHLQCRTVSGSIRVGRAAAAEMAS